MNTPTHHTDPAADGERGARADNARQQFRLEVEDLETLGLIEQETGDGAEKARLAYWRYLGSRMHFDPDTAETNDVGGGFLAVPSDRSFINREWSEFMGHCDAHFIELEGGTILCATDDGMIGVHDSLTAFNDGDDPLVLVWS